MEKQSAVLKKIAIELKKRKLSLVTAESLTGGMLAEACTSLAGSSKWFERGFVTYSNEAKNELLGVKLETLEKYSAVSEQVAKEMAEGALINSHNHAQISISTTGLAGPASSSDIKPGGTVYIGYAGKNCKTQVFSYQFVGDRTSIREQTVQAALEQLIIFIKNQCQ